MVGMDHGSSVLKEENKKKIYKFKLFKNSKEPNSWLKKTISHSRSMFLNFSKNKNITNQQKLGTKKALGIKDLHVFVYTIELYKEKFKP
jgi:hypothetical protein